MCGWRKWQKGTKLKEQRRIKRGGKGGEEKMMKEKGRKQRKVIYMKH